MNNDARECLERLIEIIDDSKLDLMLTILHTASDDSDKIDDLIQ